MEWLQSGALLWPNHTLQQERLRAKISKIWMREYEIAWKDNKQPNHLNVFQGFLSDADSDI